MKQRERQQKALSLHDAALDSLHRIEAVSGLMPAASEGRDSRLDAREIEAAASIICEETTKVRNTLDLMRGLVNSAKPGAGDKCFIQRITGFDSFLLFELFLHGGGYPR